MQAMKNVFVQDEGIDLGSDYYFGNPATIKNTSYLIEVAYEIKGWELKRVIITGSQMTIIYSSSVLVMIAPEIIKAQFKRTKASIKENLSNLFRRYLARGKNL